LTSVGGGDRLDELGFEMPLVGGDRPAGVAQLSDVAELLRERLAVDDPLVHYAARLADPSLTGGLRGYLTGSIDLVVRSRDSGGHARYSVVDYKTNWLAPAGEPLHAWHYRVAALAEEMQRSHYALQALLYLVALHRYLRWRVRDYDPTSQLAGVHYLFLRGMLGPLGPEGPVGEDGRTGVFSWRPPSELVVELSDLLDGR
jgi:exodeoxyribonuclease V beta subunit